MRSYLPEANDVNAADLRDFPEPVWSYERRTRWWGEQNPAYRRGSYTRLRRKIERQVEREDRWLASFLLGHVHARLDPLVAAVLLYVKTGTPPAGLERPPAWIHETRARLEHALALRPDEWWAVRAPETGTAPSKDRSPWWIPRRSWGLAWRFIRSVRALRRYLLAVVEHTVRQVSARREAQARDVARRVSDLSSGHPYPQREAGTKERGPALGETAEALAAVLARVDAKVRAACPPSAM